jgi:hypothetical protein
MATEEKFFVVHAWRNTERSGEKEVFELPRGASYLDTLKGFIHDNDQFLSADIGKQTPGDKKPIFLGDYHDGKFTAYVC